MTTSPSLKLLHRSEIEKHADPPHSWVTLSGRVYAAGKFAADHPGGQDLIEKFGGKDIGQAFEDVPHSEAAYAILESLCIGRVDGYNEESQVTGTEDIQNLHAEESVQKTTDIYNSNESNKSHQPQDEKGTSNVAGREIDSKDDKKVFLDLTKPLVIQILRSNWQKDYYLTEVHKPHHLPGSANMLGPPWLEMLSKTSWWVIPAVWGPVASYLFCKAVIQFSAPYDFSFSGLAIVAGLWVIGCFIWTILEYTFHRFIFHVDELLPDHQYAFAVHFLLHGVHHFLPMDKLRLVMPPVMFFSLQYPCTTLAYKLLPDSLCNAVISGVFSFYILYDCMHYALHHTKLPSYLAEMKKYHLAHHYTNYELGFGVTSKMWDYVFGTPGSTGPGS